MKKQVVQLVKVSADQVAKNMTKLEDRLALKAVYKAMQTNDLAIWLGGGGVFQNAGLVLAIASRVPADKAKALADGDMDREKLLKAAEKTGIAAKLEAAKRKYFALSPRWPNEQDKLKTKFPVVYWLNPMEQDQNNFGYFTVEELEQWAEGKGPVPMTQAAQNARRGRQWD